MSALLQPTVTASSVTPDEYCADKAAPPGSDVYYSVLFLSPERRRATVALEAVRRELEDAVRDASDPSVVQTKLQWWRQELARLFEGRPEHPATKALQPFLNTYDIGAVHLGELLAGVEADAMQNRYLDWPNLRRHGDQVAGVAGRLAARIAGHTHARTLEFARQMSLAEQLVHFIRNLGEDVRHNRIYIPVDELQRFNVPAADLFNRRYAEGFKPLMASQAERARATYNEALAALPTEDRRAQRPALIRGVLAMRLLDEVEADGFQVLTQRTDLTPLRKLWLAWKTQIRG
ncbi:presqualene diphosphate synthase HpnD [Ralstonia mannitolilytica]|uniref:Dehydrosqualene synthase n=1 Tax=Ralstonia mannitolilytica TaxID=105219 RepID=A0AAJ5D4F1_9RALS|nr:MULTISPECIES: presqualene diphosphate synthase HpnD [Ralstonia]MBU9579373.1 presqualene diphosphate synthase HpnD [Ralstonia mannitolilytica]CAG2138271.1 15-cis-phytoene synthase [Ralstonia mannitolilytica]CAJ0725353.1 15-cis-phytoene synthase [Ralstonia mannitolilytica]SUD87568.1 Dehydrosqualene synthase [Ralstonia mannitolilytica]SUD93487.1 Dehydrosqualene synthase [Ralstonia mannitolilytica]